LLTAGKVKRMETYLQYCYCGMAREMGREGGEEEEEVGFKLGLNKI
jgi:hypothetical protein